LPVILHVRDAAGGGWAATVDSPSQRAAGIAGTNAKLDSPKFTVEFPSIKANFAGTLSADGKTLDGTWTQTKIWPLVLKQIGTGESTPLAAVTPAPPVSVADAYKTAENQAFAYRLAPIFLPRDAPAPPTIHHLSLNDRGEAAFNAVWGPLYHIGPCGGGVYTSTRVVANCGDRIQTELNGEVRDDPSGIRLLDIDNVQIDNNGVVYYQATYYQPGYFQAMSSANYQLGAGFFIEKTLVRGSNKPRIIASDSQLPDRLVKGTDGRVYLFTRDGSVSTDGKTWTFYSQGFGPPGLEQLRDQKVTVNPEGLSVPFPWQPGQTACGPVLTVRGHTHGSPYRGTFYNSQKQPVITITAGSLGTRSVLNTDAVPFSVETVLDPVAVVTPAGKLLQEVPAPPDGNMSRRSASSYQGLWKGLNLTLTHVDFASRPALDSVLMNRQGQIAFRASGSDEHGRPIIGVIATPLKPQNCPASSQ
jgi:hypothetical protein